MLGLCFLPTKRLPSHQYRQHRCRRWITQGATAVATAEGANCAPEMLVLYMVVPAKVGEILAADNAVLPKAVAIALANFIFFIILLNY